MMNKVELCGVNTSKLPLLREDEKEELFRRIQKGDEKAREEYIKGNLRLVLSVLDCVYPWQGRRCIASGYFG